MHIQYPRAIESLLKQHKQRARRCIKRSPGPVFAPLRHKHKQQQQQQKTRGYKGRRDIAGQRSQKKRMMDARKDKRASASSEGFCRAQLCAPTGGITRTRFTKASGKNYKRHKSKVGIKNMSGIWVCVGGGGGFGVLLNG